MRGGLYIGALAFCLSLTSGAAAQEPSLTDMRDSLGALSAELEALRSEVSQPDHAGLSASDAGGVLVRLDHLAEQMRQLTGQIEAAENRILRLAEDGALRIRDIERRITVLEGGDPSLLSETPSPLGTVMPTQPVRGEQPDFDQARAAFDAGDMASAVQLLTAYLASYPDSARAGEARLYQGRALAETGAYQDAARAFLKSFSGAPDAPSAPQALLGLAVSLDHLGQHEQACLTLSEILIRYPELPAEVTQSVAAHKAELACA